MTNVYTLKEYIKLYFSNNQSKFARLNNRSRRQVNANIKQGFIVVNGELYHKARNPKIQH